MPEDQLPTNVVLPCLRMFLKGIKHWNETVKLSATDPLAMQELVDGCVEMNMELCVASLKSVLHSDFFFENMVHIAMVNAQDWEGFSSDVHELYQSNKSSTKLQSLWNDLKVYNDPLQLCLLCEPSHLRDTLGVDMQNDDVTRRTLMLAMWSTMDRSSHSSADIDDMALFMHDIRDLQGSRSVHFAYNLWLSLLFILSSSKLGTPDRIVARHFLLWHLPKIILSIGQVENEVKIWTRSPFMGILQVEDLLGAQGVIEQAFARVRQWPQFLHVNVPSAPTNTPDVWNLVCDAFTDLGAMDEQQVRMHIKPLVQWQKPAPESTSRDDLRKNVAPKCVEDVLAIESMVQDECRNMAHIHSQVTGNAPVLQLWNLLCEEVTKGSRCSAESARVIATFLGVPPDLANDPVPVAVYVHFLNNVIKSPATMDIVKAQRYLENVLFGISFRLDVLGSRMPSSAPDSPNFEVHKQFGDIFLIACLIVNRYKLHQSDIFMESLERESLKWTAEDARGCYACWLRRHSEIQKYGKLNMEDRTVENKLVESVFNQNWGKKAELEKAVKTFTAWAVLECVPSFAERVFQGCCADRMQSQAAAQALHMLISVVRYAMVDTVAHLCMQATSHRTEQGGKNEAVSCKKAIEVLLKLLTDLTADETKPLIVIDRNMSLVLHRLPEDSASQLKKKLQSSLDLSPIDLLNHKKVIYDVLVSIHRGGPQLQHSEAMRLLRRRIEPYELAKGMIDEVIFLSSQSSTAASIATTFNLCSIGTFLLSHGSLDVNGRNLIAESFMLEVLPSMLLRLENQRHALLLARFTTMLAIANGCNAWKSLRQRNLMGTGDMSVNDGASHAQVAVEAAFGQVPHILTRLSTLYSTKTGLRDAKEASMLSFALSMLSNALRVRWLSQYMDLMVAAEALRRMGFHRLAWLAIDTLNRPQQNPI
uniref:Uncharacterized protein n=1 Tax=Guillardia theta TaxID=55529 RepID=A0A7S4K5T5_GUITH